MGYIYSSIPAKDYLAGLCCVLNDGQVEESWTKNPFFKGVICFVTLLCFAGDYDARVGGRSDIHIVREIF